MQFLIPARIAATLLLAVGLAPGAYCGVHEAPPIPGSAIFAEPEATDFRISPDGRWIAFLTRNGEGELLRLRPVRSTAATTLTAYDPGTITDLRWAADSERLILTLREGHGSRIEAVDIDDGARSTLSPPGATHVRILGQSKVDPNLIAVAANARDADILDVWTINVRTAWSEPTFLNEHRFSEIFVDCSLDAVIGAIDEPGGGWSLMAWDSIHEQWIHLLRWNRLDATVARVVNVADEGREVYLAAPNGDHVGLWMFRRGVDGLAEYELVHERAGADLREVLFHPGTGLPQVLLFHGLDAEPATQDPFFSRDVRFLRAFRDEPVHIVSRDAADHLWIVRFEGAGTPPETFLYHRGERRLEHLALDLPGLLAHRMPRPTEVRIRVRDGVGVPALLTLPLDHEDGTLPLILQMTDDPVGAPDSGFQPLSIYLASRGYAVLRVFPRGSLGQGRRYAAAAGGALFGTMADDLIDAALWAVEAGIADPDRIAIIGQGLGGMVALAAITYTPEFFAAGIAVNSPVDLITLLERPDLHASEQSRLRVRLGADLDPRLAESVSPLYRAERVAKPLLIVSGTADPTFDPEAITRFVRQSQAGGASVVHIELDDRGIPFETEAARIAAAEQIEAFLSDTLNAAEAPDLSELLDALGR